jgi:CheY-like chemotaxis protein
MTILCIDDEEMGLTLRKLMLEREGYQVLTAGSGDEGIELLKSNEVHAVLLDYNMPGLDGGEVARRIRQLKPNLPVIMLSGCAEMIPSAALEIITSLVTKGGAPEQLLFALRHALEGRTAGRITILNVDDNEQHRYAISRVLRDAGFAVIEASSGMEALNRATVRPNLIVLDVNLPDMVGFEVCKRLKANPITRDIPVIHVSASYGSEQAESEALAAGAEKFLVQPMDLNILVEEVRTQVQKTTTAGK